MKLVILRFEEIIISCGVIQTFQQSFKITGISSQDIVPQLLTFNNQTNRLSVKTIII